LVIHFTCPFLATHNFYPHDVDLRLLGLCCRKMSDRHMPVLCVNG